MRLIGIITASLRLKLARYLIRASLCLAKLGAKELDRASKR